MSKTWQIDPSHSQVSFSIKHMMVATVRGNFSRFKTELHFNPENLLETRVRAEIDTASIDTRDEKRDEHLRSADFFHVDQFPKMTFVSKRMEHRGDNEYLLVGDLTIIGVTREVELEVEYNGTNTNPWGVQCAGFSATASIDRTDFGMTWNAELETGGLLVAKAVKLQLDIEAALQDAPVLA